jgi:hypothetical protein
MKRYYIYDPNDPTEFIFTREGWSTRVSDANPFTSYKEAKDKLDEFTSSSYSFIIEDLIVVNENELVVYLL